MFARAQQFLEQVALKSIQEHEVARFESIAISDFRNGGTAFVSTVKDALRLISEQDPRRFSRVKRNCPYIVNHILSDGSAGEYRHEWAACILDYGALTKIEEPTFLRAFVACLLVHEATHGVVEKRNIRYQGDLRARIERLCMKEQNRFAARLEASAPDTYFCLQFDFRESDWTSRWSASRLKRLWWLIQRYLGKDKA